jgi:hypothetical protein
VAVCSGWAFDINVSPSSGIDAKVASFQAYDFDSFFFHKIFLPRKKFGVMLLPRSCFLFYFLYIFAVKLQKNRVNLLPRRGEKKRKGK